MLSFLSHSAENFDKPFVYRVELRALFAGKFPLLHGNAGDFVKKIFPLGDNVDVVDFDYMFAPAQTELTRFRRVLQKADDFPRKRVRIQPLDRDNTAPVTHERQPGHIVAHNRNAVCHRLSESQWEPFVFRRRDEYGGLRIIRSNVMRESDELDVFLQAQLADKVRSRAHQPLVSATDKTKFRVGNFRDDFLHHPHGVERTFFSGNSPAPNDGIRFAGAFADFSRVERKRIHDCADVRIDFLDVTPITIGERDGAVAHAIQRVNSFRSLFPKKIRNGVVAMRMRQKIRTPRMPFHAKRIPKRHRLRP